MNYIFVCGKTKTPCQSLFSKIFLCRAISPPLLCIKQDLCISAISPESLAVIFSLLIYSHRADDIYHDKLCCDCNVEDLSIIFSILKQPPLALVKLDYYRPGRFDLYFVTIVIVRFHEKNWACRVLGSQDIFFHRMFDFGFCSFYCAKIRLLLGIVQ